MEERRHLDRRRPERVSAVVRPIVLVPLVIGVIAILAVFVLRISGGGDTVDALQRRESYLMVGALLVLVAAGLIVMTSSGIRRSPDTPVDERVDRLTGTLDRRGFREAAAEMAARSGAPLAVALVDVDRFRAVNEFLGQATGDAVLRWAATALTTAVGSDGIVARLEGDRFVVAAPGGTSHDLDVALADVMEALAAFRIDDRALELACSAGVSSSMISDTAGVDRLLGECSLALHQAKRLGRGRVVHLDAMTRAAWEWMMDDLADARIDLGVRLQRALDDRSIVGARVVPFVAGSDASDDTGELEGPALQLVADFAGRPFAVLDATLDAIARSSRRIPPAGLRLWFEVSARDLAAPGGAAALWSRLSTVGLSGSPLGVEIVGAGREDVDRLGHALEQLGEHGVLVAVPAVGVDAVPLAQLATLPIDRLVVDTSSTDAVFLNDPATMSAVRAACLLGGERSIDVLAVGVGSIGAAPALHELGIDLAQVMITEAWAPPRPQLRDRG